MTWTLLALALAHLAALCGYSWAAWRHHRARQRLTAIAEGYTALLASHGIALWDEEG